MLRYQLPLLNVRIFVVTIISKYLIREITLVSLSICGILLLILLSGRLVKYLSTALSGNIDPEVIFAVLGYRIPGFLELAFPLAFFVGNSSHLRSFVFRE